MKTAIAAALQATFLLAVIIIVVAGFVVLASTYPPLAVLAVCAVIWVLMFCTFYAP